MLLGFWLVFVALLLIGLLTLVSILISEFVVLSREEASTYECGFEHHSYSRLPFSIRYFMLTLVFLVFDMEIMFLLFVPMNVYTGISHSVFLAFVVGFVVLLIFGLIYEWLDGSLDWVM